MSFLRMQRVAFEEEARRSGVRFGRKPGANKSEVRADVQTYRSGHNEPHSKCGRRVTGAWVRIPPSAFFESGKPSKIKAFRILIIVWGTKGHSWGTKSLLKILHHHFIHVKIRDFIQLISHFFYGISILDVKLFCRFDFCMT